MWEFVLDPEGIDKNFEIEELRRLKRAEHHDMLPKGRESFLKWANLLRIQWVLYHMILNGEAEVLDCNKEGPVVRLKGQGGD